MRQSNVESLRRPGRQQSGSLVSFDLGVMPEVLIKTSTRSRSRTLETWTRVLPVNFTRAARMKQLTKEGVGAVRKRADRATDS